MWPFLLPYHLARPVMSLGMDTVLLAVEAQQVMALRMLKLAAGGAKAEREAERMLTEKAFAAARIGATAAAATAVGRSAPSVARGALRGYRKEVRANRRRLSR